MSVLVPSAFASPVDRDRYGDYHVPQRVDDSRPLLRFNDRINDEPGATYPASAHRYHLYVGHFCPFAHRALIVRSARGLNDVITTSVVHPERDGRGWAFRQPTGADSAEGFALLREAFEATDPGFDGHVSVPVLWDRHRRRIVSNDYTTIEIDLATQFESLATPAAGTEDLYRSDLRGAINELNRSLTEPLARRIREATTSAQARRAVRSELDALDHRLRNSDFLVGDRLTLADIRLFVLIVRFDTANNVGRSIAPGIDAYPFLHRWALRLLRRHEYATTTQFDAFAAPGWDRELWAVQP